MRIRNTFIFIFIFCGIIAFSQNKKHILLANGIAHIGNGKIIENSYVAINNGKIEMVAPVAGIRLSPSVYDTIIEIPGKHVYPALINCNNILGLQEAEMIRPTSDFNETGFINPHVEP